ncbi:MAG: tRNA (guanine-N7)-methyltransferase, partial [Gammaproteobacteria bacterium]
MHLRKITSFVKRSGRLTEGQRKGLTDLWPRYGLDIEESPINIDHIFKNNHPITIEIGFGNGDT